MLGPGWRAARLALWRLRNTFLPKLPIRFRFSDHVLRMEADGQIVAMMWGHRFEHDQRDFVSRYVKEGMVFINIGANSGLYTLMASKLVSPTGAVHAFEPSTENYVRLDRNLKLNQCRNVVARKLALSDFKGQLALQYDLNNPSADGHFYAEKITNGRAPPPNTIEMIPCDTLDDYMAAVYPSQKPQVDMIVIDVEGAEIDVFRGGAETIDRSANIAIYFECTQRLDEIDAFLTPRGFKYFEWDASTQTLHETPIKPGALLAHRSSVLRSSLG